MKAFLALLFVVRMLPEHATIWGGTWAPLQLLSQWLSWKGLKFSISDLGFLFIAFAVKDKAPKLRSPEIGKAIGVSLIAIIVEFLWGLIHGGSAYQVQFQVYTYAFAFVIALAISKVLITPADFVAFGKILFFACLYRACTCISNYIVTVKTTGLTPFVATTHEDSVVFVLGIVMLTAYLIEVRGKVKKSTAFGAFIALVLLVLAIQFNNRRLAWVSLVASLIVVYALIPPSLVKKKINRTLFKVAPFVIVYVAVGTGRPEKIFAPLSALSSVKSEDDPSTKSRDVENMGLIVTVMPNPMLGTGWGIEYNEIDDTYSRAFKAGFSQYRYMPHNSFLGFVAFTGFLGFASTWLVVPVSVFLNTRAYMVGRSPPLRMVAMVGVCVAIIIANQGWGDLGFFAQAPMTVAGLAYAAAMRLPRMAERERQAALNASGAP